MSLRKKSLLIPLFLSISLHSVEINNYPQAIDLAGKQRALSYIMSKYKAMLASKLIYKDPKKLLNESQISFLDTQKALKLFVKDKNILEAIYKVDSDYNNLNKMISANLSEQDIEKFLTLTNTLKDDANSVVDMLVKKSGIKDSEQIGKAGYIRALSQKLSLYYVILSWLGEDRKISKKIHGELHKTINELGKIIKELSAYPNNTKEEKELLNKISKDYLYFKMMMHSEISTPAIVLKKSSRIFSNADKLVNLYKKSNK